MPVEFSVTYSWKQKQEQKRITKKTNNNKKKTLKKDFQLKTPINES